ncbi:hypothetical protein [Actinorugispora endophytica]|uniref:hypothetical protein n=1 Tax=Actinorugispora endophytica TaxID=1605990 RepID=UPI001061CD9D|nr:hypothetical protein [Actinorugispora endophytica]
MGFSITRLFGENDPAVSADSPPSPANGTDVVGLLPNSEDELRQAVAVAEEFTAVFLSGDDQRAGELATPGYADMLAAGGAAPPVLGEEVPPSAADVEVAAEVTGIRDLAADSVTYLVRADVTAPDAGEQRFEYAVNLARSDGAWLVNGFQDAALGDAGAV